MSDFSMSFMAKLLPLPQPQWNKSEGIKCSEEREWEELQQFLRLVRCFSFVGESMDDEKAKDVEKNSWFVHNPMDDESSKEENSSVEQNSWLISIFISFLSYTIIAINKIIFVYIYMYIYWLVGACHRILWRDPWWLQ